MNYKKIRYKAIFCDLDGTLLNSQHRMSKRTVETIKSIIEKGIKVYLSTGRHYLDAKKFYEILNMNSFLITCNGAKIHNNMNEEIYSADIPARIVEKIINLEVDNKIHKNIFSNEGWFVEEHFQKEASICIESGFKYEVISSLKNFIGKDITKFFYVSDEINDMVLLYEKIKQKLGDEVQITQPSRYMELMIKGVSKGDAIKKILELEGIDIADSIAFGDGTNDIEMLSVVNKGFIMGNGHSILKNTLKENEIIDTNDNDGVAKKLEELYLI